MFLTKSNNPWIAGLSSFAIHLAILLMMAVWTVVGMDGIGRHVIQGEQASESEGVETFPMESQQEVAQGEWDELPPLGFHGLNSLSMTQPLELQADPMPQEISSTSPTASLLQNVGTESVGSLFVGSSVEGRTKKNRVELGSKNGATDASEAAVDAALAYIVKHQRNNGSWSVRFEESPCQGECDHTGPDRDPHQIAATGLALLCLMGAGNTLHEGEYSEQVSRGVYFLVQNLKIQSRRGTWLTSAAAQEMYEHGIATLALCEALQMTGDESLKEACQAAINTITYAQFEDGGWNYHPYGPGDLSIVGWQVMALKSAFSAKLQVPPETIRKVDKFLRQQQVGEFMFKYRAGSKPTASMTAIGVLMKILRGNSKTDASIFLAMDYFVKVWPQDKGDIYFTYYASQALFHFGGKPWNNWNTQVREYLVRTQDRDGHMAGSWWFPKSDCKELSFYTNEIGGRFYVTAMACLTLEVYYRYLPVYNAVEDEFKY